MKTVRRALLVRAVDGACRKIGTLKQVYGPASQDFYFFPAIRLRSSAQHSVVDHFSFHFTGQTHVKLVGGGKNIIAGKDTAIPQTDHGYSIFLMAEFAPDVLPVYTKLSAWDVTIHPNGAPLVWMEISFVNTGFLLGNELGFGTLLSGVHPKESYINREVVVASEVPNNHLLLYFTYGAAAKLQFPRQVKVTTFSKQMRVGDSLK